MSQDNGICRPKQFLLMTLDPVHIGTGGQRLGRVDNSIAREPGTRLPKIPGTSLSGAVRQYAAIRYESLRCAGSGQEKEEKEGHCRNYNCPVCYTFGYLKGQEGGQSGVVSIGDARLLLFPVYSLAGPVWVTCPDILSEFGVQEKTPENQVRFSSSLSDASHLNMGWLMLEKDKDSGEFIWPEKIGNIPKEMTDRAVLVSNKLFSQIVNSNLEIRTSVSINPMTGAAESGALFTYEAIPRAAVLWMDVVEDDFKKRLKPEDNQPDWPIAKSKLGREFPKNEQWSSPLDVVRSGLKLAKDLGIGGMGTRGFGRVRLLAKEEGE